MTPSLYAVLTAARAQLASAGIASPDADAVELASFVLGVPTSEVRRRMVLRDPIDDVATSRLADLIAERSARIPLQHLTGRAYFRGLTLAVGPGVFVPRPETEVVTGLALEAAREAVAAGIREPVVVDLCTGSGAIALAVKDELPAARILAVEKSEHAYAWAQRNRELLGLDVELRLGDAVGAFPELAGSVDVVVSNPPYIPTGQVPIDPEVRNHDPELALYGGSADGLAIPRLVAACAATLLKPGGVLVMEHADAQGPGLSRALASAGDWFDLVDHRDLAGRPRALAGRRAF
ncbi:MAG TPA: peptide chain release factor N(5)-glutamine methyltransferase [Tetrasphaera sp.]|uniref:peptide chain release factor N(5)-glutamine methyltransferase n=1 Tax=Nostocoides sp. TaxID=1917966 RepID=UPI002CB54691|nr:peptide chain release factor N(5)-glutamine methyltransferase [Tetrasphaera sp.]HNQ05978.1 peptide chain release factor N(5)-glutamine methyltransferase [Tetrasphaera sp.]